MYIYIYKLVCCFCGGGASIYIYIHICFVHIYIYMFFLLVTTKRFSFYCGHPCVCIYTHIYIICFSMLGGARVRAAPEPQGAQQLGDQLLAVLLTSLRVSAAHPVAWKSDPDKRNQGSFFCMKNT